MRADQRADYDAMLEAGGQWLPLTKGDLRFLLAEIDELTRALRRYEAESPDWLKGIAREVLEAGDE